MVERVGPKREKPGVEPHKEQALAMIMRNVQAKPLGDRPAFQRFQVTEPVGEMDRDPAGARVSPAGYTVTNSAGTFLLDSLVIRKGLDVENYALEYGFNLERMQVALYPVAPKTFGSAPVRRSGERRETVIYLKPLFRHVPDIRPESRRTCVLYEEVDAAGEPCIVLALNIALPKGPGVESGSAR